MRACSLSIAMYINTLQSWASPLDVISLWCANPHVRSSGFEGSPVGAAVCLLLRWLALFCNNHFCRRALHSDTAADILSDILTKLGGNETYLTCAFCLLFCLCRLQSLRGGVCKVQAGHGVSLKWTHLSEFLPRFCGDRDITVMCGHQEKLRGGCKKRRNGKNREWSSNAPKMNPCLMQIRFI